MDYPGQEEAPEAPRGGPLRKSLVPLAPAAAPDPLAATRVMGRVANHKAGSLLYYILPVLNQRRQTLNVGFS